MSAAKMVADSTQSDVTGDQQENKRKRHRRDKKNRKDSRKRRVSASPDSGSGEVGSASDEFDSDTDLKKELKPLHAFLGDRTALLDEMLRSVRGSSLQRALPAKLRDMPLEELRRRCLEQLQVMSRKRIKRIMAGDDPAAISSSGTDDETSFEEEEKEGNHCGDADTGKVDSTSGERRKSDGAETGPRKRRDDAGSSVHSAHEPLLGVGKVVMEGNNDGDGGGDGQDVGEAEEEDEEAGWPGEEREDVARALFPEMEQDRMELLELEMRARAIKAMLALHERRENRP